jgi:competence protein ComEC
MLPISSSKDFLAEATPDICIIQVGENNDYGHPAESVLKRLKKQGVTIFRTDQQGDIILRESDGKLVYSDQESNETGASADKKEAAVNKAHITGSYVLNTKSMKFHDPNCYTAEWIKDTNRQEHHGTKGELISRGYIASGICNP